MLTRNSRQEDAALLERDPGVTAGDTDPFDAFDPADEWIELPQDDFSGLGN